MTEVEIERAPSRRWQLLALTAGLFLPASFALFHFFMPLAGPTAAMSPLAASGLAAALATALVSALVIILLARGTQVHNARIEVALNNMPQGLCMFDRNERLVICNTRYVEIYKLSAEVATPGVTLAQILAFRAANGTFPPDPDKYRRELVTAMAQGMTLTAEAKSAEGRLISVINRSMAGGGWVGTHEDITDRRDAERERAAMQQQRNMVEQAIAAFRQRVEQHMRTVSEGAMAMRSTATTLFANSGQTSKSAESAVSASNEASVNVETAAIATDELSGSISEISRQLSRTTDVVRAAVGEAQGTNQQIAALAQAAQKIGDVIKLIRTIAGQTNLLALNATIEAARAPAMPARASRSWHRKSNRWRCRPPRRPRIFPS